VQIFKWVEGDHVFVGAKVTEETTLPAALLMNLIFLCGLFTFAVVLGFVSEEIKSQLRSVKAGNYAGKLFWSSCMCQVCMNLCREYVSRQVYWRAAVALQIPAVIDTISAWKQYQSIHLVLKKILGKGYAVSGLGRVPSHTWQKSVAKVQHKSACAHELARPCDSPAL
jgi:hypothetical protein